MMTEAPHKQTQDQCELTETDQAFFLEVQQSFRTRLRWKPEVVTDTEIRNLLGEDVAPAKVRNLGSGRPAHRLGMPGKVTSSARKTDATVGSVEISSGGMADEGKRLRKKANRALHKRLFDLGRILDEVDAAVAAVLSAPGKTNQQRELQKLLDEIEGFRTGLGWPREPTEPPAEVDPEIFRDLLIDPDWKPPENS